MSQNIEAPITYPTKAEAIKVLAPFLVTSIGLAACSNGGESGVDYLSVEPAVSDSSTTIYEGAPEGLPGTVKDGSDAAIMEDVVNGLTNCGGLRGELWTDKPYSPDHMFAYYDKNPAMVKSTLDFWIDVMGEDALKFAVDKAATNRDTDSTLTIEGEDLLTEFTQKHIANTDVPEGTIEKNHNCVDTDGDGKADTIKFLDLRVARHANGSLEGNKRTTLAGLVLHKADFEEFVKLMKAAGKDPEQLIHYGINLDVNEDAKITDGEKFEFIATSSAICENPVLKGELPPTITVVSTPPGMPPMTVTVPITATTIGSTTSTTRSSTSTTRPRTTTTTTRPRSTTTTTGGGGGGGTTTSQPRSENRPSAPEPVQGGGDGGEADTDNNPDNEATTSTTNTTTQPSTTTTQAGNSTTTTEPAPTTTSPTTIPG